MTALIVAIVAVVVVLLVLVPALSIKIVREYQRVESLTLFPSRPQRERA